ncbi:4Fe-4S single cluster domain-containing protein [Cryptosporangium aurantiacum]|uniref:Anaerobic ribonucleoside-triphosphate reductase activating protein n=1 Tax=Cryptosporangium aurantiacum TaxID=134849 RepID=A0A1M7R0X0_9ACTN|nr:4Fe-4S single cluster domain-containing protein [Cryptosporangium aurantiacum]SHN38266.1 anaerobic ribonucleoside-triphosphate reductase activating protein [Cryptosporangium aurantiacum]
MTVRLSRAHYPITVLGPGRRLGLWFQGCSIGCHGCIAQDTWAPDAGVDVELSDVERWLRDLPAGAVDGVTISGGEPFDQPEALAALLERLDAWRSERPEQIDLLCYTGRSTAVVRRRWPEVLARLDAVITGPFVAAAAPGRRWRGSANQELLPLSPLGRARYEADIDAEPGRTRMQLINDGSTVYYVGIPAPGQLERFEAALAERGLAHREASWRS